jgi:hypothetical protein
MPRDTTEVRSEVVENKSQILNIVQSKLVTNTCCCVEASSREKHCTLRRREHLHGRDNPLTWSSVALLFLNHAVVRKCVSRLVW